MKEYRYNRQSFFIQVKFTGWFCIAIAVTTLVLGLTGTYAPLMIFLSVIALYTAWNTFISRSTVEIVRMDENEIQFETFGKVVTYPIQDLKVFKIREFPSSGKMYLRINDYDAIKGRYWIQTAQFNDGKELFLKLIDLEYKLFPETLKSRARTVNTEYIRVKHQKELAKKEAKQNASLENRIGENHAR